MIVISSAFSLKMVDYEFVELICVKVTPEEVKKIIKGERIHSVVGHKETAELFSRILGIHVEFNRKEYKMLPGDTLIVGMPHGRLPEGYVLSEEELQSIEIDWRQVKIV